MNGDNYFFVYIQIKNNVTWFHDFLHERKVHDFSTGIIPYIFIYNANYEY